jgi:hypothetical protein
MTPVAPFISALALACAGTASAAAPHAHQHGVIRLSVAIDGEQLSLALEAPLDSLLGFERAPRTDAERRAAAEALSRLKDAAALFKPDAAAQCVPVTTEVTPGLLAPGAMAATGEHADLDASYLFRCSQPRQLRAMQTNLFEAFGRTRRIEVQVAGPGGQRKQTLQRPARHIELAR